MLVSTFERVTYVEDIYIVIILENGRYATVGFQYLVLDAACSECGSCAASCESWGGRLGAPDSCLTKSLRSQPPKPIVTVLKRKEKILVLTGRT